MNIIIAIVIVAICALSIAAIVGSVAYIMENVCKIATIIAEKKANRKLRDATEKRDNGKFGFSLPRVIKRRKQKMEEKEQVVANLVEAVSKLTRVAEELNNNISKSDNEERNVADSGEIRSVKGSLQDLFNAVEGKTTSDSGSDTEDKVELTNSQVSRVQRRPLL